MWTDRWLSIPDLQTYFQDVCEQFAPGLMEKETADALGFVELFPDSNVYLGPKWFTAAQHKCAPSTQITGGQIVYSRKRDGKKAARYLASVFFTKEQLIKGTLSRFVTDSGLVPLDNRIIDAIIVGLERFHQMSPAAKSSSDGRLNESKNTLSKSTSKNAMSSAASFEWWLAAYVDNEKRRILDIPAEELDTYLAQFFLHGEKRGGGNYGRASFVSLRSSLDYYLKENGYPHSISTSYLFAKSREAFQRRYVQIRMRNKEDVASPPTPKVVVRRPGGEKNENLDDLDLPCNSGASPSSLPGILEKLAALKKVNRQTNRNTSSAVSIFVRYLSEKFPAEDRFMQDIPPKELDTYLTQFFTIVKKRDGSDYTAESLFALRTSLERYLVSNNYPISITKSNDFFKSQAAFSARVQSLRIMAKLGFRIAHGLPP